MKKIISIFLVVFVLSSCTSMPQELSSVEVANKFLKGFENLDVAEMNRYLDVKINQDEKELEEMEPYKPFLKKLMGKGFIAKSETISDDKKTAEVLVEAETANLKDVMEKYVVATFSVAFEPGFSDKSEKEQQQIIFEKLDEMTTDIDLVKQELILYMVKANGEWKVDDLSGKNQEFLAPIYKDIEGLFKEE
ncbi:MAG: hypothetical protein GXY98_06750 [Erysipelothrix sp.]|nr:hypothetical protein [Erysipelothrix sp.]